MTALLIPGPVNGQEIRVGVGPLLHKCPLPRHVSLYRECENGSFDVMQVWQMMVDIGADYVNTDDLVGLRRFIIAKLRRRQQSSLHWLGQKLP